MELTSELIDKLADRVVARLHSAQDHGPDADLDDVADRILKRIFAVQGGPAEEDIPDHEGQALVDFCSANEISDPREGMRQYARARDRGLIPGVEPRRGPDPLDHVRLQIRNDQLRAQVNEILADPWAAPPPQDYGYGY